MQAVVGNKSGDKKVSGPFRLYLREGYDEPKGSVVIRLDQSVSRDGQEQYTLSNSNVGLIASHSTEYIDEILKGFRSKVGDKVFVTVQKFKDDIASQKQVSEGEIF